MLFDFPNLPKVRPEKGYGVRLSDIVDLAGGGVREEKSRRLFDFPNLPEVRPEKGYGVRLSDFQKHIKYREGQESVRMPWQ